MCDISRFYRDFFYNKCIDKSLLIDNNLFMAEKDRRFRKSETSMLTAYVLLRAKGPVTVSDVVRKADVSKATFYLHYPSLRELADAALDTLISNVATILGNEASVELLINALSGESRLLKAILAENASSLADALLHAFPLVFDPLLDKALTSADQRRQARCLAYSLVGYLQASISARQKPSYVAWARMMSGARFEVI